MSPKLKVPKKNLWNLEYSTWHWAKLHLFSLPSHSQSTMFYLWERYIKLAKLNKNKQIRFAYESRELGDHKFCKSSWALPLEATPGRHDKGITLLSSHIRFLLDLTHRVSGLAEAMSGGFKIRFLASRFWIYQPCKFINPGCRERESMLVEDPVRSFSPTCFYKKLCLYPVLLIVATIETSELSPSKQPETEWVLSVFLWVHKHPKWFWGVMILGGSSGVLMQGLMGSRSS